MAKARERYRKLPGHRRGMIRGASVWLGSDHLLAVRSMRVTEEYRRYHLRDIQAIVVAAKPRFHISTRALVVSAVWGIIATWLNVVAPQRMAYWWALAAIMITAWILISARFSCTCHIITAVSNDELPSVYRTWTARRFLDAVTPRICEVQGVIEGDWAAVVEDKQVGPVVGPAILMPQPMKAGDSAPIADAEPDMPVVARTRTAASDIFIASLFADAFVTGITLHSSTRALQWVDNGVTMIEIAAAIWVFIEYYRGVLRSGIQKVAIATLIMIGVLSYSRQITAAVSMRDRQGSIVMGYDRILPANTILREINIGGSFILGLIGAAMVLMARDEAARAPGITG